jgi:outer membrane protein assembly factor BamB
MTAYSVENGETVWWVGGLTWQLKPTPVMDKDNVYVLGWAGGSDTGQQENVPPFEEVLKSWDKNHDGKLSKDEIPDEKLAKAFKENDLDNDGFLDDRDWRLYRSKRSSQNAINGFRLGGHGDMTEKNTLWQYTKSLPNCTSPLLYQGVLYMVKEGGILTALDPATGKVLKQGRLSGGPGYYYSSPVAADGKLFATSEEGKVTVVKAGADWEVLGVNDMDDNCHATPAIVDGKIYLRTHSALYCFARP